MLQVRIVALNYGYWCLERKMGIFNLEFICESQKNCNNMIQDVLKSSSMKMQLQLFNFISHSLCIFLILEMENYIWEKFIWIWMMMLVVFWFLSARETHSSFFISLYLVISVTWYILCTRDVLVIIQAICSIGSLEGGDTEKKSRKLSKYHKGHWTIQDIMYFSNPIILFITQIKISLLPSIVLWKVKVTQSRQTFETLWI